MYVHITLNWWPEEWINSSYMYRTRDEYDTKNRQHFCLIRDLFIDWLSGERVELCSCPADASYVQCVRISEVAWEMYRTHRCSVHVASYMSMYGYGTPSLHSNQLLTSSGLSIECMQIVNLFPVSFICQFTFLKFCGPKRLNSNGKNTQFLNLFVKYCLIN